MKLALALSLMLSAFESPQEKIVNGEFDFGNPAVGLFLSNGSVCTATLIGCQTVLTAAHCVCTAPNGQGLPGGVCQGSVLASSAGKMVYFQHAGIFAVSGVAVHPNYQPPGSPSLGHDIAVLRLAQPVSGIRPVEINQLGPVPVDVVGQIVGFGRVGGASETVGVKRKGLVRTSQCTHPGHLCWTFLGDGANTCSGDSGGPLFAATGGGDLRIVGVTSFGNETCLPPDTAHDADVYADRGFIAAQAGADLGSRQCGGFDVSFQGLTGQVAGVVATQPFSVAANTARLRIAANGEAPLEMGYVGPAGSVACGGQARQKFCEILNPPSGNYVVGLNSPTTQLAQVVVSTVAGPTSSGPCVPGPQSLCLGANNRFRVQATFQAGSASGTASVVKLTDETGYLWFFDPKNVEAVVKVLDACGLNNHFWVFAGGLTDVNVVLTVTDTQTGNVKTYTNPQGTAFRPIQDTNALPCQ